jgi:tol-pal system protein YbgF
MRRVWLILLLGLSPPLAASEEDLTRQLLELQVQTRTLNSRLDKLDAAILQNQQLLGLLNEVEALKSEISKLRGQVEVQTHQFDTLEKRQKDLYVDLDRRIAELSKPAVPPAAPAAPAAASGQASAAAVSPPAPPAATPNIPPALPQLDPLLESRTYEAALNQFKEANYAGAIAGFKGFLKAYPDSALAPNAQYWIGYAYFALKDFRSALAQQQKLVMAYPGSPKVPDALLNIASNQVALNDLPGARKTLEEIVAKHPASNAATLAAKRLAALK